MRNRQLVFAPKIEYQLVAETLLRRDKLRKANLSNLQFPFWCARQESNLRSHGPQPCALSTELRALVRNCLQPARLHLSVKSLRLQAISSSSSSPRLRSVLMSSSLTLFGTRYLAVWMIFKFILKNHRESDSNGFFDFCLELE